jgi:hypothetical protein
VWNWDGINGNNAVWVGSTMGGLRLFLKVCLAITLQRVFHSELPSVNLIVSCLVVLVPIGDVGGRSFVAGSGAVRQPGDTSDTAQLEWW